MLLRLGGVCVGFFGVCLRSISRILCIGSVFLWGIRRSLLFPLIVIGLYAELFVSVSFAVLVGSVVVFFQFLLEHCVHVYVWAC